MRGNREEFTQIQRQAGGRAGKTSMSTGSAVAGATAA